MKKGLHTVLMGKYIIHRRYCRIYRCRRGFMPCYWGNIYFIEGVVEYIDEEAASCPANGEIYILLKVL